MPEIRKLVTKEEQRGKRVVRLGPIAELEEFERSL
jgi:hypothetical protein